MVPIEYTVFGEANEFESVKRTKKVIYSSGNNPANLVDFDGTGHYNLLNSYELKQ